jgi:hypothetical protein
VQQAISDALPDDSLDPRAIRLGRDPGELELP